ncbi:5-dehydro-2-deoxygluconokinase [Roseimarinus sediminis]|uniref:5-dehydro-2-deoxygluconokinase n=1 Tax=Roseimarinus sediminis TaxID=1610899 RepID=UPI003D20564E
MNKQYDLITYGRSSIDLYSANIGAPFVDIKQFNSYVGGSPLNIAVGARRLGLNSALLTGVGEDQIGDYLLNFLNKEGVETTLIPRKSGARTSAVVLGIEPPDNFPLVYYRDNCADSKVNIDDVINANIGSCRIFEISATALNIEPTRSAGFFAAEEAVKNNVPILIDLDFRADQWHDPRSFGVTVRAFLKNCTIALGTEEEILATMLSDPNQIRIKNQQISAPEINGNVEEAIQKIMALGLEALVVKRGEKGSSVFLKDGTVIDIPGFPVEVVNVLGAGDAFASGFIYGYLNNWDWYKCCRMGNACGAILVTKEGCSNFSPRYDEVMAFVDQHGGL